MTSLWTRRIWLTRHVVTAAALLVPSIPRGRRLRWGKPPSRDTEPPSLTAYPIESLAPGVMQSLALRAVDAARSAGAQYADARLTRTVLHRYNMAGIGNIETDDEEVGLGVRVLVNGYWGFAASPTWTTDEAARLAQLAMSVATANAKGPTRAVDLGDAPVITGSWTTPIRIDPFTVSVEEKMDSIAYWRSCGDDLNLAFESSGLTCKLEFARQERVLATSAGSLVTQTVYESHGQVVLQIADGTGGGPIFSLHDLGWAGCGWEMILDAKIPEQMPLRRDEALADAKIPTIPSSIGRYTLVCDGATMAAVVGDTLGVATQLDRALGYEANAHGTSFLNDPLGMLGTFAPTTPSVTVTANRSAPTQLATVQWDDEGVVPQNVPLIEQGRLVDFQTTRESASWLAPYYQKRGKGVHSNGCAGAADALALPIQHMPNLELVPNPAALRLEDLVANVEHGMLIQGGSTMYMDSQARNGLLGGQMREIRNGQLGRYVRGGSILMNTMDFWKHLTTLGGRSTQITVGRSCYDQGDLVDQKGQPAQTSSFSVRAVAATITNQPMIDALRKA